MRTTLFVDDLTVLDYAYVTSRKGVRGDSLIVSAELDGEPDAHGFILDFGRMKKLIKRIIDEEVDHRLVLPSFFPGLGLSDGGLDLQFDGGVVRYECPAEALVWLATETVTTDGLVAALEARVRPHLPPNVSALRLGLRPDPRFAAEATFAYTHGLKHHDGNCQRMLHGHRNVVEARFDGRRDGDLERALIEHVADKHFACADDVRGGVIAYGSAQGEFRAELPPERIIALPHEPSIEHIAAYAHGWLAQRFSIDAARLTLTAYEGLRKGARVSA